MSAQPIPETPPDTCPYRRPFPAGFRDCPAYQPNEFVALDTQYQVLGSVRSCAHLDIGAQGARNSAFYPRCRLGDAAARALWAEEVKAPRLRLLAALRSEYATWAAAHLETLWAAKGRQLEALRSGDRDLQAVRRRELDELLTAFLVEIDGFLDERQQVLEELGLPVAASKALYRAAFDHWLQSSSGSSDYQVPDEILEAFPEQARILLRPREVE